MQDESNFFPYAACFFCGLTVYIAIITVTGFNEAWDHGSYYWFGIPFMCYCIFLIASRFPHKPWRWVLAMTGGQMVAALLNGSSLNLLPLALIFMVFISIPQWITASWASKRVLRQEDE